MLVSQGLRAALSSKLSPCYSRARGMLAQDPSTQNAPDYVGELDEKLLSGKANLW